MPNELDFLLSPAPAPVSSWEWAVVTSVSPLLVRLDGDTAPLMGVRSLVRHLHVGGRVRVEMARTSSGTQPIIHGPSDLEAGGDWVTVPPLPGIEVANGNPAQVIALGGSIHMRGNLAIPAGITDSAWLGLCEIPAGYRPGRFRRVANGGYATAAEYAPSVIGVEASGLVRIGRAGGPAGAATITTAYLDLTWPRA